MSVYRCPKCNEGLCYPTAYYMYVHGQEVKLEGHICRWCKDLSTTAAQSQRNQERLKNAKDISDDLQA